VSVAHQWQTPILSEIPLTKDQLPSIADMTRVAVKADDFWLTIRPGFPDAALLAALSPASRAVLKPFDPEWLYNSFWWQLAEHYRRAFRAVDFDNGLHAVLTGKHNWGRKAGKDWLRWLAVSEAMGEMEHTGRPIAREKMWEKARQKASERLVGTVARGKPSAMKFSYDLVQRVLREPAYESNAMKFSYDFVQRVLRGRA
jgi:hypothetical protein